jgi:hypothetical protein
MTAKPDERASHTPETGRADARLLVVAALYCVGARGGFLWAAHGAFGTAGFAIAPALVCAGPVLWLGIVGIAFEKHFSWLPLTLASLAIWGMTVWNCVGLIRSP